MKPSSLRIELSASKRAWNIDLEFVEFDNILNNRMDTLIPKFAALSAAFVSAYKNARIIVDSGGGGPSPTPPTPPTPPPA
jgi:hypothetical protein